MLCMVSAEPSTMMSLKGKEGSPVWVVVPVPVFVSLHENYGCGQCSTLSESCNVYLLIFRLVVMMRNRSG